MPWISVHQEVDGTKLRRLYRAIGCSKFEALGILNFLWFWGMKNADETGLVKDADLEVLSRYLYGCGEDCQLDMGKVVQALVDTGWIDVAADGFTSMTGTHGRSSGISSRKTAGWMLNESGKPARWSVRLQSLRRRPRSRNRWNFLWSQKPSGQQSRNLIRNPMRSS